MAEQLRFMAMSHGPQLMVKPNQWDVLHDRYGESLPVKPELEKETIEDKWAKWERCMKAIATLRETLAAWQPEALVIVADDQHENLVDDVMPPFTIYIGQEAEASVSLNYFNEPKSENRTKYTVHAALATALVNDLMEQGFDPAYSKSLRYEGGLGHAFARPLKFLTPDAAIPVVPVMVNTYYPPAPSAKRCVEFGRALAVAIRRVKGAGRVAVLASGGLSHTLIDEELDGRVLRALEKNDADALAALPSSVLVSGTSEIRNWVVVGAAANAPATVLEYVPCYRTSRGVGCAMGFAYWK